jgi:hypothetical protein
MSKAICVIKNFILWTCIFFIFSCQSNTPTEESNESQFPLTQDDLYGKWQILSFKVTYNALLGIPDSQYVFEVKEENWQQILATKPTISYFYQNNTFRQEFIDNNNVPYDTIRGIWNLLGDTLMLISPTASYTYQVSLQSNRAIYSSIIDWDGDGEEDDEYFAIYKQLSKSTN